MKSEKNEFSIRFYAGAECKLKIKLYHYSPLSNPTEKVMAQTHLAPGNHSILLDKKEMRTFGSRYLVVKANEKPLHIECLKRAML